MEMSNVALLRACQSDVTPFMGLVLMRVGGRSHAAAPS